MLSAFSPFVKCICPGCFEEICLGDCRILSSQTGKPLKYAPNFFLRPIARTFVEPLDGEKYTNEQAYRECPNIRCSYALPYNIERVQNIMLAVVGDNFSGKSHYIAALIHLLENEWFNRMQGLARWICLTPDVRERYRQEYLETVFGKKQTLPPSPPTLTNIAKPLIYELSLASGSSRKPQKFNLLIYDRPGEDFEHWDRLSRFARFVFKNGGLIYVADPVLMPRVYENLPQAAQDEFRKQVDLAKGRRAAERFSAIIAAYLRFHKKEAKAASASTPIAVMVSKSDLLHSLIPMLGPLPPDKKFRKFIYDSLPHYSDCVDLQDLKTVDKEVREILSFCYQGDLLAATNGLNAMFFATSATGIAPIKGHFNTIKPCRCLDPLLWILYQRKAINARP